MSTIDEQITDVTNKKNKVDDIYSQALDLSSKIDPVVNAFQETGNYLYGVRIVGKSYDDEYLKNTASSLNTYKEELNTLANDCLVESNKLGKRKSDLEAEKKKQEEEAAAAAAAAAAASGAGPFAGRLPAGPLPAGPSDPWVLPWRTLLSFPHFLRALYRIFPVFTSPKRANPACYFPRERV